MNFLNNFLSMKLYVTDSYTQFMEKLLKR